jgi:outer membrane usher protein FimD/PapC
VPVRLPTKDDTYEVKKLGIDFQKQVLWFQLKRDTTFKLSVTFEQGQIEGTVQWYNGDNKNHPLHRIRMHHDSRKFSLNIPLETDNKHWMSMAISIRSS